MKSGIRWTPIALLETTNLLSGMSNGVVTIAIPWLVLQRTGSVAAAGLVAALSALPGIVASPFAGWAVDHFGRRIVSIVSDILSAISVAAIPLVAMVTDLNIAIILALAMLGAVFDPAGYTARRALIPDVAQASGMEVTRLNGLHEGIFGIGWIVGPLAGSLLIATLGDTAAFWAPFGAFVLAAILISLLRVTDAGQIAKAEREQAGIEPLSAWQNAALGARLLWRDRTLRAVTIAVMVLAAIYLPTETVLLPAYFTELDSPEMLGFILAALSAGAMIGSFSYGWLNQRMSRRMIVYAALFGSALTYIPMALLPPIGVFITFAFLCGLSWGPMQPLLTTIVQLRIDPDAQGRVFGIQTATFYVAPPAAMFLAGVLAESYGVRPVLLGIAGLLVITALAVLRVKSLRDIDSPGSRGSSA
ncbi:MAG TPA: MFS transporter [Actinobacteria bacterium]|nr:MFS transporter [Actinomycetota bacterium]